MAVTEKEVLSGLLSAAYQMDENGVASLYNEDGTIKDDALDTLKKLDVERVQKLKPDTKKYFDDGYKKAQSEVLAKFEKEALEKFGIKSDKKGLELIAEIVQAQAKASGNALNDDEVKKHPLYISTVDRLQKEKDEAVKAESEKLSQFQSKLEEEKTFNTVASKAKELFYSLNPILSNDKVKAEAQVEDFVSKLKSYGYTIQNGSIIALKDGKVLEDAHGNRIPFEKVVKETAERFYDFKVGENRQAPGNGKPAPNDKGSSNTLKAPKDINEYNAVIADSKIPVVDRQSYVAQYEKLF